MIRRMWTATARFWETDRSLSILLLLLIVRELVLPPLMPGRVHRGPVADLVASLLLPAGVYKEEAYRRFYMHRTGHWIGMDVHDVGQYKVGNEWRVLEPGMALTIEPGLYIPAGSKGVAKKWWNIGIRVEDDVLVTKKGHDVLTVDAIKEPDDNRRVDETVAVGWVEHSATHQIVTMDLDGLRYAPPILHRYS